MTKHQWIMGGIGFAAAGPLGALAAIALEKIITASGNSGVISEADKKSNIIEGQRNSFLFSLLVLSTYIIQADKKVMPNELNYVLGFFEKNFGKDASNDAKRTIDKIIGESRKHSASAWKEKMEECCKQMADYLTDEQLDLMIRFLINIANSDRDLADEELSALYDVAGWLGVDNKAIVTIENEKEENLMSIYENVFEITDLI